MPSPTQVVRKPILWYSRSLKGSWEPWFSKCGPGSSSLSFTRKLVRNADSQAHWITRSRVGPSNLYTNKSSGWFWCRLSLDFPGGWAVKNSPAKAGDTNSIPGLKICWGRNWQPTPVFLPVMSHGQRSLAAYSPWSHKRVRPSLEHKQHTYWSLRTADLCDIRQAECDIKDDSNSWRQ